MTEVGIETVNAVAEFVTALFFFDKMSERRGKKIGLFVAAAVLALHIARSFLPIPTYANMGVTCLLWAALIAVFKGALWKKGVVFALYFVALGIADMLCRYIMAFLVNATYASHAAAGLERYIGMVLLDVLMFLILFVFVMVYKNKSSEMGTKYKIIMLLFPIFSLFIVICTDMFIMLAGVSEMKYILALCVIVAGLLFFNVTTFEFMDTYSAKLRLGAAEELIKNQAENYKLLEANETELKKVRHNIEGHMEVMREMIKRGALEESTDLEEHLRKLESLEITTIYTGDAALDAILNVEARKAAGCGIKYLVKAHELKHEINMPPIDKSTILCNAVNNAIEACREVCDAEKFVVIDLFADENTARIRIENSSPVREVKNNHIFTSKKNAEEHGFGLNSIKQTVEKYNGIFDISYKDGIMTSVIRFNNNTDL